MRTFDLTPINGRKSFYGKCKVIETDREMVLRSYETEVAFYDKRTRKVFFCSDIEDKYSNTTSSHISAFLDYVGIRPMTKKDILNFKKDSYESKEVQAKDV